MLPHAVGRLANRTLCIGLPAKSINRILEILLIFKKYFNSISSLWSWASKAGGQGGRGLPWNFIHGTDIVDRSLIVRFFGLFCVPPPPLEEA